LTSGWFDAVEAEQRVALALDELLWRWDPLGVEPTAFFGVLFDAGLAIVDQPLGRGGLGVPRELQRIVDDRLRAAGAKSPLMRNPIGVGMGIPTLLAHGSQVQVDRYLRPCFTGEEFWCQLFSEPGAGSDLAGLATRAELDGDSYIVKGQKVWTSRAERAQVGMLLARTDIDAPKHRGISFFLVDMSLPGVTVRPLRQMTGDAEFNEVFLDDVPVPVSCRIGAENDGWRVAITTLNSERVVLSGAGGGVEAVGGSRVDKVLASAAGQAATDPVLRHELVQRWMEGQVIRWTNQRARDIRRAGRPGPEGAITKLYQGLFNRSLQETAIRAANGAALAWSSDEEAPLIRGFLRAQANTIEGGTSNVLRNVLADQVLGLPREPGPPRDTPWRHLPNN
jgi:alkylation response protein AidB-like acyl-CoA dehydrogenase